MEKPGKKGKKGTGMPDFFSREITLFGKSLPDKKKERFYSELQILLFSGVDIRSALDIIAEEQTNENHKRLFRKIHDNVVGGMGLSESIESTSYFTPYEYYSIRIGEESGRLTEVLKELGLFYARKIKQRRQIIGALTYPLLVLVTAIGAVFFMLRFVVPMFKEVFHRFKGDLPSLTKFILHLSDKFTYYALAFLVVAITITVLVYLFRKKEIYRKLSSGFLLSIPYVGKVYHKIYLARFCQAMTLLVSSKTPLIKALQLTRDMIQFYPFEKALEKIESDIMHGSSLHKSMQQFSIFDRRIVSLTRVAEEVNQLDVLFAKLDEQYTSELEYQLSIFGNILEPFLIVLIGLLVAVILISMYLPLFQLGTNIY